MPLGDGESWSELVPDDSSYVRDGDDYILHDRKAVRIRMNKEHVWPANNQSVSSTDGFHRHITLQPYASGTTPNTFVVGTTAGAIGMCSTGTGYGMYVSVSSAASVLLINDKGQSDISFLGLASQTKGDIFYSATTSGMSRLGIGSTGQFLTVNATTGPQWTNTMAITCTFAENVTMLKNITVSTGATVGTLSCTGTSTLAGNVLLSASASVGGALAVAGALTNDGDAVAKIKVGTYTGDGSASKAIAGVGFVPKFVGIWPDENAFYSEGYRTNGSNGTFFREDNWASSHGIISFDADGFTVAVGSGGSNVNASGKKYQYLCLG